LQNSSVNNEMFHGWDVDNSREQVLKVYSIIWRKKSYP
jgi:hypothetical protein